MHRASINICVKATLNKTGWLLYTYEQLNLHTSERSNAWWAIKLPPTKQTINETNVKTIKIENLYLQYRIPKLNICAEVK